MKPWDRLARRSVVGLVRVACLLALGALAIFCISVVFPEPLLVILAMSAGHAVGGAAFACYLLAVILDAARRPPPPTGEPRAQIVEVGASVTRAGTTPS